MMKAYASAAGKGHCAMPLRVILARFRHDGRRQKIASRWPWAAPSMLYINMGMITRDESLKKAGIVPKSSPAEYIGGTR